MERSAGKGLRQHNRELERQDRGNAWNDDTQHTIGKPKQAHKQMWETDSDMGTVEETVGVRQAYAKQEQKQKQMIAQVKAEVSQAEEKKIGCVEICDLGSVAVYRRYRDRACRPLSAVILLSEGFDVFAESLFPHSIWICQELGSGKWYLKCFLVSADPGGNCCSSVSQRNATKWNRGEDDRKHCDRILSERILRNWKPDFKRSGHSTLTMRFGLM